MVTLAGAPRMDSGRLTRALIIENPDRSLDDELRALGITPQRLNHPPDEDELCRVLAEGKHHLIYKRSGVEITDRVVQASPNLAAVMLCCIGDDSVDLTACAKHGVMVMNDPVSNGRSVAEMVIGELICLSRRIFDSVIEMNTSTWRKNNKARYEVLGKTLGLLGMGNIGRQVAQLGHAMGMKIVFYDTAEVPRQVGLAMGWTSVASLADLFAASDFVSCHVSATDVHGNSNAGLVDYDVLRNWSSRPDSPRIFINLARGVIVPPETLLRAVKEGLVNYALTDVFPEEPKAAGGEAWTNPYQGEPRIFATPHIGAATQEAQPRIARYVAHTTQLFSHFGMLRNCVFKPRSKIAFGRSGAKGMLVVVHSDRRGTKKIVDEVIYDAQANNLRSAHIDFPEYGIAYEVAALDRVITLEQCQELAQRSAEASGDPDAVRWVRSIPITGLQEDSE